MNEEQLRINELWIESHKEKTRASQRSTDYVRIAIRSLALHGWSPYAFSDLLASGSKKPFDLISLELEKVTRETGDVVSVATVFPSSDCIAWNSDRISYNQEDGMSLTIDEFVYVNEKGLGGNQFFAVPEKKDGDVEGTWKALTRRASEARKDKAINILYATLGGISWEMEDRNSRCEKVKVVSPLFLCSIKEDANSKSARFTVNSSKLQINQILARTIRTKFDIDLYEGCEKSEFAFSELRTYMDKVRANVEGVSDIEFLEYDMHICLLDSSNEVMCQAIERNRDEIAHSELVSIFAESALYEEKYGKVKIPFVIYPLPADDSQREVVERALAGDSLNVHAGPGTGKSQTSVNVAANLVVNGKRVAIICEKAAANEVEMGYFRRCGMDGYILYLHEGMSVREIISQIKRLIAYLDVYVDTEQAREVIEAYHDVLAEFKKINRIYELIPEIGSNLYQIIGEAMSAEDMDCSQYFNVELKNYRKLYHKLNELQTQYIDNISEQEWNGYLITGTTGDEEQDDMIEEIMLEIEDLGVKAKEFMKEHCRQIEKHRFASVIREQLSSYVAGYYIDSLGLKTYGNRKLKMLYKKLLETSNEMRKVGAAYVQQELGRRVKEAAKGSKFVELLDRLATSRISLQDFFNTYGSEIIKLCPIIVSTPNVLVNYDKLNNFDVLIVDESSQTPITSVMPFMRKGRQLILFGDPMQLDITSYFAKGDIYEQEGEEFDLSQTDKSILHVSQGKLPGCRMKYHYRSKTEHLLTVSDECCYDGLLNVAPDVYLDQKYLPEHLGYEIIEITDPELSPRGANLSEAQAIGEKVEELMEKYPDKSIGIITFNDNQQHAIYDELEERLFFDVASASYDDKLWIRTLENAQGKEADIILISIGHARRNKDGSINKAISEICKEGGLNRLNVLFTRAREKVVVAISFSYKELKDSDNKGVYRLYQYLHYAATGEFAQSESRDFQVDKYNEVITRKVQNVATDYTVTGKVGRDSMTVDVALVKNNGKSYDMGFLLSNKALSPNAICTKVMVLERAGWNLLPLSPISCYTKPEVFESQLKQDIESPVKYSNVTSQSYITDNVPPELFTIDDFKDTEELESAITTAELLSENFEDAYAQVWSDEVKLANGKQLAKLSKTDMQAKLRLITLRLPDFIQAGKVEELIDASRRGYEIEKQFGYLYAQLLRVRADIADESLINRLLAEAKRLGIKTA